MWGSWPSPRTFSFATLCVEAAPGGTILPIFNSSDGLSSPCAFYGVITVDCHWPFGVAKFLIIWFLVCNYPTVPSLLATPVRELPCILYLLMLELMLLLCDAALKGITGFRALPTAVSVLPAKALLIWLLCTLTPPCYLPWPELSLRSYMPPTVWFSDNFSVRRYYARILSFIFGLD